MVPRIRFGAGQVPPGPGGPMPIRGNKAKEYFSYKYGTEKLENPTLTAAYGKLMNPNLYGADTYATGQNPYAPQIGSMFNYGNKMLGYEGFGKQFTSAANEMLGPWDTSWIGRKSKQEAMDASKAAITGSAQVGMFDPGTMAYASMMGARKATETFTDIGAQYDTQRKQVGAGMLGTEAGAKAGIWGVGAGLLQGGVSLGQEDLASRAKVGLGASELEQAGASTVAGLENTLAQLTKPKKAKWWQSALGLLTNLGSAYLGGPGGAALAGQLFGGGGGNGTSIINFANAGAGMSNAGSNFQSQVNAERAYLDRPSLWQKMKWWD